jgi:hypothetical protein
MTVRRLVPSTEHNAEAALLDVWHQHLAEMQLVHLEVAGDLHVAQVACAAEQIVETR